MLLWPNLAFLAALMALAFLAALAVLAAGAS